MQPSQAQGEKTPGHATLDELHILALEIFPTTKLQHAVHVTILRRVMTPIFPPSLVRALCLVSCIRSIVSTQRFDRKNSSDIRIKLFYASVEEKRIFTPGRQKFSVVRAKISSRKLVFRAL